MAQIEVTVVCESDEEFLELVARINTEDHGFTLVSVDSENRIIVVSGNVVV